MQTSQPSIFRSIRSIGIFVGHQLIATMGIMIGAALVAFATFPIIHFFQSSISIKSVHRILTENPHFPLQIIQGLFMGYMIHRRFKHAAIFAVWALPLFWLMWCFFSLPQSVLENTWMGRLNHFFGNGCALRMIPHCYDQLIATLPLYASLAYSAGAWVEKIGLFRFEHTPADENVGD